MGNACRTTSGAVHEDDNSEIAWMEEMERQQKLGQKVLRDLVNSKDSPIDWKEVITQAETLHQTEIKHLKKRKLKLRRHPTNKKRDQKVGSGSYTVNLLTLSTASDEDSHALSRWRGRNQAVEMTLVQ